MASVKGGEKAEAALKALARKLGNGKRAALKVGFLENAIYEDTGVKVALVAFVQNFGAPSRGIPPRPFFTQMIDQQSGGWPDTFMKAIEHSDYDVTRALGFLGEKIKGQLQQAIRDIDAPALSKVTLLLRERFPMREGMTFADVIKAREDIAAGVEPSGAHSNPLVWTGKMERSVEWEVTS